MAELWQSYGSWVLYGLFFLVFLWLHGFMHGHGGHGGHGERPQVRSTDASPPNDQPDAGSHLTHASDRKSHKHTGGCC